MATPKDSEQDKKDRLFVLWITLALVGFGLVGFAIFALSGCIKCQWQALGAACVLAGAAFTTGALLGLLFGIPRPQGENALPNSKILGTNTNLIQISDWLTKALVGVSLTQFYKIPDMLTAAGRHFDKDIGSGAVATAVLVHFGMSGFLSGYLLTRVVLQQAFHRADQVPEGGEDPAPPQTTKITDVSDDAGDEPSDAGTP